CEGKHAVEAMHEVRAPRGVAAQDHFRVGAGAEALPEGLEFPAQRAEVVELAVVDDAVAAVLGGHRLAAGAKVDDRKPGVTEKGVRLAPQVRGIRAARGEAGERRLRTALPRSRDQRQDST